MKLFTLLFFFLVTAHAQIKPVDQQYMSGENYLLNNGFESGRANWTQAGTATATLEQSVVRFGVQSYKIVASSQTVDLSQVVTKYAAQSGGQQGLVSAWIKSNSTIAQVCAVVDSVDTNCVTIDSGNTWKEYVIPFVMGSTNNGIRIKSASDSGTTYIDNAFVGVMPATMMPNVENISQWKDYGAITITATTTNPTKATTRQEDSVRCREVGNTYECEYRYNAASATGAAAGSGDYIFSLPSGIEITDDISNQTSVANLYLNPQALGTMEVVGVVGCCGSAAGSINTAVKYSSNSFRIRGENEFSSSLTVSSSYYALNQANLFFYFTVKFKGKNIGAYTKIYSGDTIYPHAQLYGTLSYAAIANCIWGVTSTTYASFHADTDCNNATVTGSVAAPSTKIPAVILPVGSPVGTYQIVANGNFLNAGATAAWGFRLFDGTNGINPSGANNQSSAVNVGNYGLLIGTYEKTTNGEVTIQVQGKASSSTANIRNDGTGDALGFSVYYFPPKDNPIIGTFAGIEKCADDFECTDVFSAKVSSTGVVSAENLDWINGNCTIAGTSVYTCNFNSAIFTTPPICNINGVQTASEAWFTTPITSSALVYNTRASAGGDVVAAVELTCNKTGSDYKPKTAKAATTNEMMYVPNVTRPKTCYYAFGGAGSLTAPTNCTTGTCIEYYDSCSAGSPPTKGSAGEYNDLIFTNGTWKNTTPILCKLSAFNTTTAAGRFTSSFFITGDNTITTNSNGGYTLNLYAQTPAGGGGDSYWLLECTADAP